MSRRQLVVFDFDWSFVDQDTDRWVLEVLSTRLRRKLQTIKAGGSQCTPDVVAECMVALAEEDGIGKEKVLESLRILPLHPAMKRAVTALKERDPSTTFVCISNSNEVYIDTILKVRRAGRVIFSSSLTRPIIAPRPHRLVLNDHHQPGTLGSTYRVTLSRPPTRRSTSSRRRASTHLQDRMSREHV